MAHAAAINSGSEWGRRAAHLATELVADGNAERVVVAHGGQFVRHTVDVDLLLDKRCRIEFAGLDHIQHLTVSGRLEAERSLELDLLGDDLVGRQ